MLRIWTSSKPGDIKKAVLSVLQEQKYPTPHKIHSLKTNEPPSLSKGEVCLSLGAKALAKLQDLGLCPKGRTITSMRGKEIPYSGGVILVTYDPGIGMIDYSKYTDMQIDVAMANRRVMTGTLEPEVGNYRWVKDFNDLVMQVKVRYAEKGRPVPLTYDLETVGLIEYNEEAWIVSISFTIDDGMADVIYFEGLHDQPTSGLLEQIDWLLNTKEVITRGANAKFDRRWIKYKWGLENDNYKMDTTLVGSLLDENRSNSLNTHAKVYTSMGGYDDAFNAKFDKSQMHKVPKKDLLPYAGGDTDADYRVANVMRSKLLQDSKLANFYVKLLHPASITIQHMEEVGILLDVPYYMELQQKWTAELARVEKMAISLMSRRLQIKHRGNLKLTRAALLKDHMFSRQGLHLKPYKVTEKTGQPSTAKDHLIMFADKPEVAAFLELYQEYTTLSKTLNTYVTGFLKHLRSDGRFHPTGLLHRGDYMGSGESGTVTGRLAFKDPAAQTIPKHTKYAKPLRKGYIAPPGFVVVNFDYSQGELKVTACVANEPTMIRLYKEGIDLHMVTGGQLNGYTQEDMLEMKTKDSALFKVIRQGGKAGNFGLIYGMSAGGYQTYAKDTFFVTLNQAEANYQREEFFRMYPGLVEWHRQYKAGAHRWGYIRSPLGRIRHLPLINSPDQASSSKAERQSINSPVQSTLSDLTQYALVLFNARYGRPHGCQFFMTTHDSLAAYILEDEVDAWVPRMTDIMENLPLEETFGWEAQLQFTTDAEMGPNLAEMEEL